MNLNSNSVPPYPVRHIILVKFISVNAFAPIRRIAVTLTNSDVLLIRPLGIYFNDNFVWNSKVFIRRDAFDNVVCKMAATLLRHRCVNILSEYVRKLCQLAAVIDCAPSKTFKNANGSHTVSQEMNSLRKSGLPYTSDDMMDRWSWSRCITLRAGAPK